MNNLVTVFTALYNRKDLLPRLYESLKRQTCFSFEWLICDDCSADGSYELAQELAQQEDRFPIRVLRTPYNGGKHRVLNYGAPHARGFMFFIVDSDDMLPPDSIEKILRWEETIRDQQNFAGLGFLKADLSGTLVGTSFPEKFCDCTTLERDSHRISGDKAEVFYTELIRQHPYPEFEGERYMTPAVVWDRIAHAGLKIRWINEIAYLCEYQPDGLSANWNRLITNNPRGYTLYLKQKLDFTNCHGYQRYLRIYGYYYAIHQAKNRSMKYVCELMDYPLWKAYFYAPIRKGHRVIIRLRRLLDRIKHQ